MTDPNTLIAGAVCARCIPTGLKLDATILLAQSASKVVQIQEFITDEYGNFITNENTDPLSNTAQRSPVVPE